MTFSIYLYIQRGLFERHKLTFALMLTNKIQVSAKALSLDLVNVFLKGGGSLDPKSVKKKPHAWIPDKCWLDLVAMSQHKSFADIVESINVNEKLWRAWYDKEAPEAARVPDFEGWYFFAPFPNQAAHCFCRPSLTSAAVIKRRYYIHHIRTVTCSLWSTVGKSGTTTIPNPSYTLRSTPILAD